MELNFSFEGEVWHWRGPAPFHFVSIPTEFSAQIAEEAPRLSYGWGAIAIEATCGQTQWTTAIFPKDGLYIVPLKDKVRKAEEIELGEVVHLSIRITSR